jgi:hypothetical protein
MNKLFNNFSDGLFYEIFKHLDPKSIYRCLRVSKQFQKAVLNCFDGCSSTQQLFYSEKHLHRKIWNVLNRFPEGVQFKIILSRKQCIEMKYSIKGNFVHTLPPLYSLECTSNLEKNIITKVFNRYGEQEECRDLLFFKGAIAIPAITVSFKIMIVVMQNLPGVIRTVYSSVINPKTAPAILLIIYLALYCIQNSEDAIQTTRRKK